MAYDSKADTLEHIKHVNFFLLSIVNKLLVRASMHDNSKLQEPEKSEFDRLTPRLATLTYGSEEYKESLKELKVALDHHYAVNSHHPEHYPNGIDGMNIIDLVEMYCDWQAAVLRTKDGSLAKSIEYNKERFNMSPQLVNIFLNSSKI